MKRITTLALVFALLFALSLIISATGMTAGASANVQPPVPEQGHEHEDDQAEHDGHAHPESQDGETGHDDHAEEGEGHDDHAEEGDGHDDHADEGDGHDDHAGEEASEAVQLSPDVMTEFGIVIRTAESGLLEQTVRLPGEVLYNADRIADVTPSATGITQHVNVSVGDHVEAGQVLAVLRSQELAMARSDYLAAISRLSLAQSNLITQQRLIQSRLDLAQMNLDRDKRLFEEKVGSERVYLESTQRLEELRIEAEMAEVQAQRAVDEAEIAMQQADTSLHALGLNHEQIERTKSLVHTELNEYELTAPLSGIVTERNLTIGELAEPAAENAPLIVADLSTVWVNLTVYQRDLAHVREGQPVEIKFGHGIPDAEGEVAFISPALDESTRTAYARIVLKNPDRHWRPGLFVEGIIETGHDTARVAISRSAVIGMDDQQVVFVETHAGLEPRPVRLGREDGQRVEILQGLKPGERYAATGALTLKAQMNSASLEHAGHAH